MILDARIHGIPCQVHVTRYVPGVAPVISGSVDRADPGSAPEVEFDVLDCRGRPAWWLERVMDDADVRAIEQEIIAAKAAERERDLDELAAEHYYAERA